MARIEELAPQALGFHPVDAAVGVIVRPVVAMRQIAARRPWPMAMALYIAITLLNGLVNLTSPWLDFSQSVPEMSELPGSYGSALTLTRSPLFAVVNALLCSPVLLVAIAGVFYLTGRLLGGRGYFSGLLSTFAFAVVPTILLAPMLALLNLTGALLAVIFGALASICFAIWVLVLQVLGIRESLALSTGRAVATLLIPIGVVFLLFCALFLLIVALVLTAAGAMSGG